MGACCGKKPESEEAAPASVTVNSAVAAAPVAAGPVPAGAAPTGGTPVTDINDPLAGDEELKISIQGGGGKAGKVEIATEAELHIVPNDSATVTARKSHKKDSSAQDFDSKRKEYVYEYLNKEGGYLIDPANKKNLIRVEPGTL